MKEKRMKKELKILITGSSGYIGKCLIEYFLKKTDYFLFLLQSESSDRLIKNKRVKYCFYDKKGFDIYKLLERIRPDVVINLAGLFIAEHNKDDLLPLIDSNFVFEVKLLDAMRETGVKNIISTGTYWESYKQDSKYNPVDLYAALKRSFFNILEYYVQVCGFNAITLRLYDVYGPGDNRKKIIPLLIRAGIDGNQLDMSPGEQFINLIYIDDVVLAYIKAVELVLSKKKIKENLALDVGSDRSINLKDLVALIERLFYKKINVNFGGRSYRLREVMDPIPDLKKTKKALSWYPTITISDGIKKVMEDLK